MKDLSKTALFFSLFLVIGFPMIFLVVFMFTDQWIYLFSGSLPSMLAGTAALFLILQQTKKPEDEEILDRPHNSGETIEE